jgi:hypothetical protein
MDTTEANLDRRFFWRAGYPEEAAGLWQAYWRLDLPRMRLAWLLAFGLGSAGCAWLIMVLLRRIAEK